MDKEIWGCRLDSAISKIHVYFFTIGTILMCLFKNLASFACIIVFILSGNFVFAQAQVEVLPKQIQCIQQNFLKYQAQGERVVLNFVTCPNEPTPREKLRAFKARNFFPPPDQSDDLVKSSDREPVLLVTDRELTCLRRWLSKRQINSAGKHLLVLPDQCVPAGK
ncbi:MAG: hypothetical protein AAF385_14360 [Pseudomonadota bacterium]